MPEPINPIILKTYADREIFEKRLGEGYTTVADGSGGRTRVNELGIHHIWVFYHPEGGIATHESPVAGSDYDATALLPFEAEYSEEELKLHLDKYGITLVPRGSLEELIRSL